MQPRFEFATQDWILPAEKYSSSSLSMISLSKVSVTCNQPQFKNVT